MILFYLESSLCNKSILVELFYKKVEPTNLGLRYYPAINWVNIGKGAITITNLKGMIKRFEETGSLEDLQLTGKSSVAVENQVKLDADT